MIERSYQDLATFHTASAPQGGLVLWEPTHWMPLPQPPEAEK